MKKVLLSCFLLTAFVGMNDFAQASNKKEITMFDIQSDGTVWFMVDKHHTFAIANDIFSFYGSSPWGDAEEFDLSGIEALKKLKTYKFDLVRVLSQEILKIGNKIREGNQANAQALTEKKEMLSRYMDLVNVIFKNLHTSNKQTEIPQNVDKEKYNTTIKEISDSIYFVGEASFNFNLEKYMGGAFDGAKGDIRIYANDPWSGVNFSEEGKNGLNKIAGKGDMLLRALKMRLEKTIKSKEREVLTQCVEYIEQLQKNK